ncbi:glutathione S-transferase L2, chloroplastic-like isoform X2 [Silene latifolia]|uniref:glutathione S-transferase L2, chloroplastic-like isoform X2 n=1 Tax=Silene latifolia TaxID=37657 RepID=UPI003D7858AA
MASMKMRVCCTTSTAMISPIFPLVVVPVPPKSITRISLPLKYNHLTRLKIRASFCGKGKEVLPTALDSTSDPPPIFDGTSRVYISYTCPYAQRVWITRNCKGLQDNIKLVPIDLKNRPAWYKHKVYPPNKVPALEHNNEVRGESLDLIKFIDRNFEGPSLLPDVPAKQVFADVLFSFTDSFHKNVTASFKAEGMNAETHGAFDYIEDALSMFDDGPFLLGQFSLISSLLAGGEEI